MDDSWNSVRKLQLRVGVSLPVQCAVYEWLLRGAWGRAYRGRVFQRYELDHLSWILIGKWPGEIAEGNGRMQAIIDESADGAQREALRKILHGESTKPGATHFYVFNSTTSQVLDTLYSPIEVKIDVEARQASIKAEGLVESTGTPIIDPFSQKPMRARINLPDGFEYTVAEMGAGTSKVNADLKLELNGSYGQFSIIHMNQDGVIR